MARCINLLMTKDCPGESRRFIESIVDYVGEVYSSRFLANFCVLGINCSHIMYLTAVLYR